jgi:cellulose synthase/poly-beta-1,6-N-acetylglucosamine synthase-like glycosyltransferase
VTRREGASRRMTAAPRYSVIVPAYNAAETLAACLAALLDQTTPRGSYEVLVVDDGSTDGTGGVAGRFPVRVLEQAHAGPAAARNLGARAAAGRFLLFTDADCVPVQSWIEEITRPLEADRRVAGVKGAYRTRQTGLIARFSQLEFEEKYARLRRRASIDFVDTASAAFRADAFWEAGGFDPTFPAASNEDTLLAFTLAARGRRLIFAERAIVYHQHSTSLGAYLRRKWRHGYWRARVYRRYPRKTLGDSYTPRSLQLQFLGVAMGLALAPVPRARPLATAGLALFALGTLPFVRRAAPAGRDLAAAVPVILFLRALALGTGLLQGALTQPFVGRSRPRWRRCRGSGSEPGAVGGQNLGRAYATRS